MKKQIPIQKNSMLNGFFLFSGIMFVALWNLILNFSSYFNLIIYNGFSVYMTFTLNIGCVLSSFTSYYVFKNIKSVKVIFLNLIMSCLVLAIFVILIEAMESSLMKQICLLLLIFLCGYFMGAFQGEISGLAASVSSVSIARMNSGVGFSGFGSNVLTVVFYFIFPTDDKSTEMNAYRNQLMFFVALLVIIVGAYFVILTVSLKKYPECFYLERSIDSNSNVDDETKECDKKKSLLKPKDLAILEEQEYSLMSIIKSILDLFVGIICNITLSIQAVCFVISTLTEKYDQNSELLLLTYLFVYNIIDTLVKFIPPRFFVSNFKKLHLISVFRLVLQAYYTFIIEFSPLKFLTHPATRILSYFLMGGLDGFFLNNFFCMAADRFKRKENKHKSGYAMMFAANIGLLAGTLTGVLWTF